jgi:hypothetical protein
VVIIIKYVCTYMYTVTILQRWQLWWWWCSWPPYCIDWGGDQVFIWYPNTRSNIFQHWLFQRSDLIFSLVNVEYFSTFQSFYAHSFDVDLFDIVCHTVFAMGYFRSSVLRCSIFKRFSHSMFSRSRSVILCSVILFYVQSFYVQYTMWVGNGSSTSKLFTV